MFDSILAWIPKSAALEASGLAYADQVFRATQDAQRALIGSSREMLDSQARLHSALSYEAEWTNALAATTKMAEEWQSNSLDLIHTLTQIGTRSISEAVSHSHTQSQLLIEQGKALRERISMAAPDTPELVAGAFGAWLDMFGRKSMETVDIGKRLSALTEALMAITAASRQLVPAGSASLPDAPLRAAGILGKHGK